MDKIRKAGALGPFVPTGPFAVPVKKERVAPKTLPPPKEEEIERDLDIFFAPYLDQATS